MHEIANVQIKNESPLAFRAIEMAPIGIGPETFCAIISKAGHFFKIPPLQPPIVFGNTFPPIAGQVGYDIRLVRPAKRNADTGEMMRWAVSGIFGPRALLF